MTDTDCRMNERLMLNSKAVKAWLQADHRKQSYLVKELNVSQGSVDKMLAGGHIPKIETLQALARLMGVEMESLLLPREEKRSA